MGVREGGGSGIEEHTPAVVEARSVGVVFRHLWQQVLDAHFWDAAAVESGMGRGLEGVGVEDE